MATIYAWANCQGLERPHIIQIPAKVLSISSGYSHTIIQTENKLFGLGDNQEGQLGYEEQYQPNQNSINIIPISIQSLKNRIKSISCGAHHSLVLDESGQVYSAGSGRNGVLGFGRGANSYTFQPVLNGIKEISAGSDHNLARSAIKVYGWGSSKDGQLGLVKQQLFYEPQELFVFASYFCYAGPRYSIFGTEKGIYATGFNESGQLGLGHQKKIRMPKKLSIADKILKCMGSCSFIIFETEKNQFFISGNSTFGHFLFPTKIKSLKNSKLLEVSNNLGIRIDGQNNFYFWNPQVDSCLKKSSIFTKLKIKQMFSSQTQIFGVGDSLGRENWLKQGGRGKSIWEGQITTIRANREEDENAFPEMGEKDGFCSLSEADQAQKNGIDWSPDEIKTPLFTRNISRESRSPERYEFKQGEQQESSRYLPTVSFERRQSLEELSWKRDQMLEEYSKQELICRIRALENENKQKEGYIKRIRGEFVNLLEIVESEEHLKNMVASRNPKYLERMSEELNICKKMDRFDENMEKLRIVLKQGLE